MQPGRYQLLEQLGAGRDGAAYRARAAGHQVEVRFLDRARADAERWPVLTRRLKLADLLDNAAARRVRALNLTTEPPCIVLEWLEPAEPPLAERVPLPPAAALALADEVAGALAAAHRLGLPHGRLSPRALVTSAKGGVQLDFTGVDDRGSEPV